MTLRVIGAENPLARVVLARLRSRATGLEDFRRYLRAAGRILAVYLAGELSYTEARVETPLGWAVELSPLEGPLVVSVLGAGEFLAQGILDMMPWAPLGFIAARRREDGEISVEILYERLPREIRGPAVLADPMLATGSTATASAGLLLERGASRVIVASVIAAPEGVERLRRAHGGRVAVYTLALDRGLDARGFILPGLGDAGDRSLGVEP